MVTRSLRRRIKKARLDVVLNDKNVKICDNFQHLVELYPDDEEPLVKQNPKLKLIYTAKYSKMVKELNEYYLEHKDDPDYDPYAHDDDDDDEEEEEE